MINGLPEHLRKLRQKLISRRKMLLIDQKFLLPLFPATKQENVHPVRKICLRSLICTIAAQISFLGKKKVSLQPSSKLQDYH